MRNLLLPMLVVRIFFGVLNSLREGGGGLVSRLRGAMAAFGIDI